MSARYQSLRGHGDRVRSRSRKIRSTDVDTSRAVVRRKSRKRSVNTGLSTAQFGLSQLVLFATVFIAVYGFSILLGSSLMENARRDKVRANARMKVAREDMAKLRNRMDRLTTMAAIDTWARTRGYQPPHGLTNEKEDGLVAQVD